jgi:CelD/BcsL family acetyltransferase involved in cellulose biosynthesis
VNDPISIEAWRGTGGLATQARAWDELARAARLDPLCNSSAWTLDYARAWCEDGDVFGWTARGTDGEALGVLALRRERRRGRFALRRALLAADGSFDSDYLDLPLRPGREREVLAALVDAAAGERRIDALVLGAFPDDSPRLAALRELLESRGVPRREHAVPGGALALPSDFDQYLASLAPRMRSKVRQAERRARELGAAWSWVARSTELEPRLDELYRLHQLRWQAAGKAGSFADPRRRRFYAALAARLFDSGELRFARLELELRPLALQLGALVDGTYYQIQEGYDAEFRELRCGTALRAMALRAMIGEGLRRYDFMAGDSRTKRDWGAKPRPCTSVAFPLPRLAARVAYRARALADRLRPRKRQDAVPVVEEEQEG